MAINPFPNVLLRKQGVPLGNIPSGQQATIVPTLFPQPHGSYTQGEQFPLPPLLPWFPLLPLSFLEVGLWLLPQWTLQPRAIFPPRGLYSQPLQPFSGDRRSPGSPLFSLTCSSGISLGLLFTARGWARTGPPEVWSMDGSWASLNTDLHLPAFLVPCGERPLPSSGSCDAGGSQPAAFSPPRFWEEGLSLQETGPFLVILPPE